MSPVQQTGPTGADPLGEAYCYIWQEMVEKRYSPESYVTAREKCIQYRSYCISIGKAPGAECNAALGGPAVHLPTVTAVGTPQSGPPLARPVEPLPRNAIPECPRDAAGQCIGQDPTAQQWTIIEAARNRINDASPECTAARGLLRWFMDQGGRQSPWLRVHPGLNYARDEGRLVRPRLGWLETFEGSGYGFVMLSAVDLPRSPNLVFHEVLHIYYDMFPPKVWSDPTVRMPPSDHDFIYPLQNVCRLRGN